jgi:hypothetical protein
VCLNRVNAVVNVTVKIDEAIVDSCRTINSNKRFADEVRVSCDEVEHRFLKHFAGK